MNRICECGGRMVVINNICGKALLECNKCGETSIQSYDMPVADIPEEKSYENAGEWFDNNRSIFYKEYR